MFEQSFAIGVIKLLLVNIRKNVVATLRFSPFFVGCVEFAGLVMLNSLVLLV